MADNVATSADGASRQGGGFLPALCDVLGVLLLVVVAVLAAPLAVPPLLGQPPYVVEFPLFGSFQPIFETLVGKVYLVMAAACGVMFLVLAGLLRSRQRERAIASLKSNGVATSLPAPRKGLWRVLRVAAVVVLLVVFVGSAGVILYANGQYRASDSLYDRARDSFVEERPHDEGILSVVEPGPPIQVDFAGLQAQNPHVVGWLYCEGTPIDYPVVQGADDEFYLTHDYARNFNINGALFVDSDNRRGFADSKTIVYGHHMNSGSMFASLVNWADQAFYEEHPVMWLLTPDQDYRVELFSGHHVNALSGMYRVIAEPGPEMDAFLADARDESDFSCDVALNPKARYIMMSTCAYLFEGDRYVLHGMLVPV